MKIKVKRTTSTGIHVYADGEFITSFKYLPKHEAIVKHILKLNNHEIQTNKQRDKTDRREILRLKIGQKEHGKTAQD